MVTLPDINPAGQKILVNFNITMLLRMASPFNCVLQMFTFYIVVAFVHIEKRKLE